ncbi:MAG TPA: MmgE/PrpD family protein [Bryobacteraceae bacterium]|nr:MmgE/PrpD family protein [Bryobacteraceae bacterium]
MKSSDVTRRSVLLTAAAAAIPVRAAVSPISPTMARLSSYMTEAGTGPLPAQALEATKQHILDTFAAMVSGSELAPGLFAIKFARAHSAEKTATVAASDVVCGAIEAAFSNAMLAHSDETDDSHAPSESHPGASVVPAALACGEQFNIDGPRFLRAVALGYDVGTRVTMTIGVGGFQTATHISTHALAGTFGSAAAAGCAASLNQQQMRWLIDYASQQASGIKTWQRDTDHIEKAFLFAGMPARNGVTAALLVQDGATGVDDVLSGQDNFLLDYAPQADPGKLIDKLGERYEITRTNIKKWTVGSPIQAPLDALETILKRRPFEADQVQAVTIHVATSEASLVSNREMPDICMQHMVAVMLLDKTASFKAAHDKARMQDATVLKQRAKVQLIPDAELEHHLPAREAIVEVTLVDGSHLTETVKAVRGTAENPMPREEVIAKARDLMTPVLGAERCDKLIQSTMNLERLKSVRELRPLLQRS